MPCHISRRAAEASVILAGVYHYNKSYLPTHAPRRSPRSTIQNRVVYVAGEDILSTLRWW